MVLDNDLTVIFANDAFYSQFQLSQKDTVGREIYQINEQQWDIPALHELLATVLLVNSAIEGTVLEHNFPVIGHRKLLINTRRIVSTTGLLPMILLSMELITL